MLHSLLLPIPFVHFLSPPPLPPSALLPLLLLLFFKYLFIWLLDFPGGSDGKASAYTVGDPGSIPESGRSPGEENGNPLQYSCLENPMDGGAW